MMSSRHITMTKADWDEKPQLKQITTRGIIAGLFIGSLVLISNFQFGLQTGWVSMMSLPSALLGFTIFKQLQDKLSYNFTDVENVFVQSVAVAVGTGPLAYGFVGVIPAIEKFLTKEESGFNKVIKFSLNELILWSIGLGFFGIFFAIPLRKQVIIKEKLPFPSGSATATLISVLHDTEIKHDDIMSDDDDTINHISNENNDNNEHDEIIKSQRYNASISTLVKTFTVSSAYTLVSYFIPILKDLPIFGKFLAENYLWTFQPSPAYIGQGMIMGLTTVSYMLFGCILGWGVLSPIVKHLNWAPGEVWDWKSGSQGWIMWISLSVMVSDSIISFIVVTFQSVHNLYVRNLNSGTIGELESLLMLDHHHEQDQSSYKDIDSKYLIGYKTVIFGIILSSVLCIVSFIYLFTQRIVPVYALFSAIVLALFLSVLGVRALGETDLNPVSGIGKLSQLIFAFILPKDHPGSVLVNLVAGAIAEAGAQQAGDLMQDLKTGHLLGASPKAQFWAQLIGTVWSIFLSAIMYKIYNIVYEIPNNTFRIPTSAIWIDCSRLVTGQGLPPHAYETSILFGVVFGIISIVKNVFKQNKQVKPYIKWLPSGVAVGIGIYNSPSFTIARFMGGLISFYWMKAAKNDKFGKTSMIVFSSGLVLGEGLFSIVNMTLTSLGVPHL